MIVIPVDVELLVLLAAFTLVFEALRLLAGFVAAQPPKQIDVLENERAEAQFELAQIKSIQLEFVRHSLLSRKVIKCGQQIDTLKAAHAPRAKQIKSVLRVLRAICYAAVAVFFFGRTIVYVDPVILWPVSWFTSATVVSLPVWLFVVLAGFSWRQIFRGVLGVLVPDAAFP